MQPLRAESQPEVDCLVLPMTPGSIRRLCDGVMAELGAGGSAEATALAGDALAAIVIGLGSGTTGLWARRKREATDRHLRVLGGRP